MPLRVIAFTPDRLQTVLPAGREDAVGPACVERFGQRGSDSSGGSGNPDPFSGK